MPYRSTSDLPPAICRLPSQAQEIFLSAFNSAWRFCADRSPQEQEERAFRIAWAALKKGYRKRGSVSMPKHPE
jgi:cation transport regulator